MKLENSKIFVINLDRRIDRFKIFSENFTKYNLPFERFSAIDGKKLKSSPRLRTLFEKNDYNMRRGIVGCALSHIILLLQLLCEKTTTSYIIFEDDAVFLDSLNDQIEKIYQSNLNWDLVFLGTSWKMQDTRIGLLKQNGASSRNYSNGGTIGYIITKQGARKFLEYINIHSMENAIDTMMQRAADIMNIYYLNPSIVIDPLFDTDIQHDFSNSLEEEGEKYIGNRVFGGDFTKDIFG